MLATLIAPLWFKDLPVSQLKQERFSARSLACSKQNRFVFASQKDGSNEKSLNPTVT